MGGMAAQIPIKNDPAANEAAMDRVRDTLGPVLGPLPQIRTLTAAATAAIINGANVQASLATAAQQADALITQYNRLN